MLFALDDVIENRRNIVFDWKRQINGSTIKELLIQYIQNEKFVRKDFVKSWNTSETDNKIAEKDIEDLIEKQYTSIGSEISELLFRQLVEQIFHKEWLVYKRDIEYVKFYLHLYRTSEEETVRKYTNICAEQYDKFQNNVIQNLLGYFLSAKLQSVIQKDEEDKMDNADNLT
jgi:hypothetical protein